MQAGLVFGSWSVLDLQRHLSNSRGCYAHISPADQAGFPNSNVSHHDDFGHVAAGERGSSSLEELIMVNHLNKNNLYHYICPYNV